MTPREILQKYGYEDIREDGATIDGERFSESENNRMETLSYTFATQTWEGFGWNNDEDGERIHESPVLRGTPELIDSTLKADRQIGVSNPSGVPETHFPVLLT